MIGLRHLTLETLEILRAARLVFHLSGRHEELCDINRNVHDLESLYLKPGARVNIYREVASHVVESARRVTPIVFADDGNPMFFNDIAWNIAEIAKEKGLHVEALPGISCIDVLPTQLGFEPGDLGSQIFEATQLVLYDLSMNIHLSTLILQVAYFLTPTMDAPRKRKIGTFTPLVQHLCKFFPEGHPAVFIDSAYSDRSPSIVFSTEIGSMDEYRDEIKSGMTLYLPRVAIPTINPALRKRLRIP